jgi:hypothetical protein
MSQYNVLIHQDAYNKVIVYFQNIQKKALKVGTRLSKRLMDTDLTDLTIDDFIEQLIQTKYPQIFAESAVYGDGSDWTQKELSILGDIAIAAQVTVYDNGVHHLPKIHTLPFAATLLYTPGALLTNGMGFTPADWDEVTLNEQLNYAAYYQLYVRRLLPSLIYANTIAGCKGKKALLTIPGLGCGQFAGKFRGQLGDQLKNVIIDLLNQFGQQLPEIKAIYYDPYSECNNERHEINEVSLLVRPYSKNKYAKSQLCVPTLYEEDGDDFSDCHLFSLVAWDHVSWPGNDFYIGSRMTDDGVKSAATNSMTVMTGVAGVYDKNNCVYQPPVKYKNWRDVIKKNYLQLQSKNALLVLN